MPRKVGINPRGLCRMRERPDLRATGRIVAILEPTSRRSRIVGTIQQESGSDSVTLLPADMRLPKFQAKLSELPNSLLDAIQASQMTLLVNAHSH